MYVYMYVNFGELCADVCVYLCLVLETCACNCMPLSTRILVLHIALASVHAMSLKPGKVCLEVSSQSLDLHLQCQWSQCQWSRGRPVHCCCTRPEGFLRQERIGRWGIGVAQ